MLDIGTLTHSMGYPEDIIQKLLEALAYEDADAAYDMEAGMALDALAGQLNAGIYIDELIDALQQYAPPRCYVGKHPEDPSDIGVWPDADSLHHMFVGALPGDCDECCCGDDEGAYSRADCDICGSWTAGLRYSAHAETSDGTLVHLDVCVDCVEYIAYG